MRDTRLEALARNLVHYSCRLQPGERVLVENTGLARDFLTALIREIYAAGANPFVQINDPIVHRELLLQANESQLGFQAAYESMRMEGMDAYIGIRSGDNTSELADVPSDQQKLYNVHVGHPVHMQIRVPKTKWVVLRYPTSSMAQQAGMSTDAFTDFFFRVCTLDYAKLSRAMDALVDWMGTVDRVRIKGEGTDLAFSIRGIPTVKCAGELNIPDGEVFTAPVKESVNGTLTFNTPSLYEGFTFEQVQLTFKNGRIEEAASNDTDRLNEILDTDAGARYVGEFALGVNPYILAPMRDTLFDEKIAGSFHFTPGQCYDEAPNGNASAIHWDMVCIQRPEYGGGEIWFDDVLVRKNGLFVPGQLQALNPAAFD